MANLNVKPRIEIAEHVTPDMFINGCINALYDRRKWVNPTQDLETFAVGYHAALSDLGFDVTAVDVKGILPELRTRLQQSTTKAA